MRSLLLLLGRDLDTVSNFLNSTRGALNRLKNAPTLLKLDVIGNLEFFLLKLEQIWLLPVKRHGKNADRKVNIF